MLLHKGETLFRQGETGPLYRIHSGLLKIIRIHEDGSHLLVNIIVPGEIIPHHSLISPKEYHGTGVALVTCDIEAIPAGEWYEGLQTDPRRLHEIAMVLQSKLRMMQQRVDQLTQISSAGKLSRLQEWFRVYLPDVALTELLTQDEIGQLIGLRRETINRLLRSR